MPNSDKIGDWENCEFSGGDHVLCNGNEARIAKIISERVPDNCVPIQFDETPDKIIFARANKVSAASKF